MGGDFGGLGGTWGDLGRRIAAVQCNHLVFIIRGHGAGLGRTQGDLDRRIAAV